MTEEQEKKTENSNNTISSGLNPKDHPTFVCGTFNNEEKFDIKKEIYSQTQSWARHNETLIIATNTILLGALATMWPDLLKDFKNTFYIVVIISIVGFTITKILCGQYRDAITRIVVYERYFGVHNPEDPKLDQNLFLKFDPKTSVNWSESFVPMYLNGLSKGRPFTSTFFLGIHFAIFFGCICYALIPHCS